MRYGIHVSFLSPIQFTQSCKKRSTRARTTSQKKYSTIIRFSQLQHCGLVTVFEVIMISSVKIVRFFRSFRHEDGSMIELNCLHHFVLETKLIGINTDHGCTGSHLRSVAVQHRCSLVTTDSIPRNLAHSEDWNFAQVAFEEWVLGLEKPEEIEGDPSIEIASEGLTDPMEMHSDFRGVAAKEDQCDL